MTDSPTIDPILTNIYDEAITVKDLLAYKARMMNVEIRIDIDKNISISVRPLSIHQVFMNLISNGIESYENIKNDETKIREVIIRAYIVDGFLKIEVEDRGCGINDTIAANIYTKSYSTKSSQRGIGLWAVKNIIEHDIGGKIAMQSEAKIGTTFFIKIPYHNTAKDSMGLN